MSDRKKQIAKIIFDWLNHPYANADTPPRDRAPFSFNADEDDLTIGVDGDLNCRALAAVIDNDLGPPFQEVEIGYGEKNIGKVTAGGTLRIPAAGIDFAATYNFKTDDGKYFWSGIKPTRDGDHAVFVLPAMEPRNQN